MKILDKEGWWAFVISIIVLFLVFVSETYAKQSDSSSLTKTELVQQKCIESQSVK